MLAVAEMEVTSLKDGVAGTYRVAAFPTAVRTIMPAAWRALAGFEPHTVAEATDFQVQLALVAEGIGVALIPELGATNVPATARLLPLRNPVHRNVIVVTRHASAGDPGLRRVQNAIADAASRRLPATT